MRSPDEEKSSHVCRINGASSEFRIRFGRFGQLNRKSLAIGIFLGPVAIANSKIFNQFLVFGMEAWA